MLSGIKGLTGRGGRAVHLRVPREEEDESALLLGDPGTGKSQIIHQIFAQVVAREPREAVICYDPAGEFTRGYYDPRRDVIFNPLDARCPYWSPASEVLRESDCEFVAESFFPGRHGGDRHPSDFFTDAARIVFARMLERRLAPEAMLAVMRDEDLLDELMRGTEHAHLVDEGARGQRAGVLATLALALKALRFLPRREECDGEVSLTRWAQERRGKIFITSTPDTREALRQLHAPAVNILLKRLRSVDARWGKGNPCVVFVDEAHTLGRLPALSDTLVEGRKYGIKMWLGAQNKSQWEDLYGRLAATILSAPHLKIFLRCNETESARWVSEMIGEEERERPRVGTTAAVESRGRDSVNYSTYTERRALVSREEIMSLPNLHGYWKYENAVVPFRIEPRTQPEVAPAFAPRRQSPTEPPAHPLAEMQPRPLPSIPVPPQAAPPPGLSLPKLSTENGGDTTKEARALSYADIDPNF